MTGDKKRLFRLPGDSIGLKRPRQIEHPLLCLGGSLYSAVSAAMAAAEKHAAAASLTNMPSISGDRTSDSSASTGG